MKPLSILVSLFLVTACSASTNYDETWGDDISGGKLDGLADIATPLLIAETVTGSVTEQSAVLYEISLQRGDVVTMDMNVVDGDLSPHFTVFFGLASSLSSSDFTVSADKLTKNYVVGDTGAHFVAVRAFRNRGSGDYDFSVQCNAGPCMTGVDPEPEPEPGPLLDFDADECLEKARECAFEDMKRFNGAVGPVRARSVLEGCLQNLSTDDGVSCADTCVPSGENGFAEPSQVCDDIVSQMPFFADQSDVCVRQLMSCVDECINLSDAGFPDDDDNDISEEPFSRCWTYGINHNCTDFAKSHEDCGGTIERDSTPECADFCAATIGAWVDDLSDACPIRDC